MSHFAYSWLWQVIEQALMNYPHSVFHFASLKDISLWAFFPLL